jgi:hypothetical protein
MRRWGMLYAVAWVIVPVCAMASPLATRNSGLNVWSEPSAGEQFYSEFSEASRSAVILEHAFESKMPGSMGFRFKFAIDDTSLILAREDASYHWYAAPAGKARAWHGMLGTVLAPQDRVGLRIPRNGGPAEWFVDNSIHNGFTTIWKRKHDPRKDPGFRLGGVEDPMRDGWRALVYQGQRDGQLVFEIETGEDGTIDRREYLFPLEPLPMQIGIQGMRAEIASVSGIGIRVRVITPFAPLPLALPSPDQSGG